MVSRNKITTKFLFSVCFLLGMSTFLSAQSSNIDDTNKWAWGTNIGWVNFKPTEGGVTVYLDHLEGFAYAESIGWIRLGTHAGGYPHTYDNTTKDNYGVNRHESGYLYGYAWSSTTGWINFNPANGGVTIDDETGSLDGYAYAENVGWIHFKNTGGSAYNVAYVNSKPVLADIENTDLEFTEGDGSKAITNTITITDEDDVNIESAVVQITGNYINGEDILEFTNTANIAGNWDAANGRITLNGTDSKANYQAALRAVKYKNSLDDPTPLVNDGTYKGKIKSVNATPRTVSFTIIDGSDDSNTEKRIIKIIPVNDAPVVSTNTGITLDEAAAITIESADLRCTDPDGNYFVYTITSAPQNGTLYNDGNAVNLNGTFTQDELIAGKITYTHNGSETIGDSFKFEAADNHNATTPETTFDITLHPINDSPILADMESDELTYPEKSGPVSITSTTTLADVDDVNIESASIEISDNYINGEDILVFINTSNIIGSWDAATGTMTLSGTDTKANYQLALRSVKYKNTSENSHTLISTEGKKETNERIVDDGYLHCRISFMVNDGRMNSNIVHRIVKITTVNDLPVIVKNEGLKLGEGTEAVIDSSILAANDVDSNPLSIRYYVDQQPAHGTLSKYAFTQNDINQNRIIYTHDGSDTSEDSFTFKLMDEIETSPVIYTFSIVIIPFIDPLLPPAEFTYRYNEAGEIELSWKDSNENEDGYIVWRQEQSSPKLSTVMEYVKVATLPADSEFYIDLNVEEGKSYTYKVTAFVGDDNEVPPVSEDPGDITAPSLLTKPTNLQATANENATITIAWDDNSQLETGYKIERCIETEWTELTTVAANTNNYNDIDVIEGTTYNYRVKATGNGTESIYSNESCATCIITEVNDNANGVPVDFTLNQNYPNPFNPSTTISYGLPEGAHVKIAVFNMLGQEVAMLVDEFQNSGYHNVTFNAAEMNSGIYLYKVEAGSFSEIRKMILMK